MHRNLYSKLANWTRSAFGPMLVVGLLMLSFGVCAKSHDPLVFEQRVDLVLNLQTDLRLVVDHERRFDYTQALQRFQQGEGAAISGDGLITSPTHKLYWLLWQEPLAKLSLGDDLLLEVEHPYPMMNRVDLIVIRNQQEVLRLANGMQVAIADRNVQARQIAFELPQALTADDQILLLIDSEATQQLKFRLISKTNFAKHTAQAEIGWGIYFGIIALSIIYNLLIYFAIGNKSYLFYVLYMTTALLGQVALSSHGLAYLWPDDPQFGYNLPMLFIGISSAFGLLFIKYFLETHNISRNLDRLIVGLIVPSIALAIAARFTSVATLSVYSDLLICFFTITALLTGIFAMRKGIVEARYFLLAWGGMLLAMLVYILSIRNLLPLNVVTTFSPQIATFIDLFFLSFAIADQVRQTRRQREETLSEYQKTIQALHRAEGDLIRRALYNSLTGLPNKSAFYECINNAMGEGRNVVCLIMKIKGMRGINQTIGHHIADQLLKEIAIRVDREVATIASDSAIKVIDADSHYVAALGGIKCGILLESSSEQDGKNLINTLINNLPTTYQADRFSVSLSLCAGMALSEDHGDSAEELMRNAQIALEHADKNSTALVTYSNTIDHYSERRLFLISELQNAIANDSLDIHFQPQLDLQTNSICGVEALLRWHHPEHGFIGPDEFVPLAEEVGSINDLTRWVINHTLAKVQRFHQQGFPISVSINLSAKNIVDSSLTDYLIEKLYRYDIAPEFLTLELTETASMEDPELTLDLFKKWHHIGIEISIDDFGTGYSSLAYLKELPVDEIKIDRAFIRNIDQDEGDLAIVKSIIDISHNMKLRVVGEGIENEAGLNRVKELHCDIIQGYWFSRPVPADELLAKLQQHKQETSSTPYVVYDGNKPSQNT